MINTLRDHHDSTQDSTLQEIATPEQVSEIQPIDPAPGKIKTDNKLAVVTMNIATVLAVVVMFIIKQATTEYP